VWRTRVGYAGGALESPTYHRLGDHTESFQLDFDPDVVSYHDLLDRFWLSHDATRPSHSTQYASLILAADDEQLREALDSRDRLEARTGRAVSTRVEPLRRFWLAEDYHQRYEWTHDRRLSDEIPQVGDYSPWAVANVMGVEAPRTVG
jgi:peptide-methionine (S)-S-oxide reductase